MERLHQNESVEKSVRTKEAARPPERSLFHSAAGGDGAVRGPGRTGVPGLDLQGRPEHGGVWSPQWNGQCIQHRDWNPADSSGLSELGRNYEIGSL